MQAERKEADMPIWGWALVAVGAVIVIALIGWGVMRSRRSRSLRSRFGAEYERATADAGRRAGESELAGRVRRRQELDIRPLPLASAERYVREWRDVQARFVDSPAGAIQEADLLITAVMRERGYPMDDFDQRAADISVDYPEVVEDYRRAHAVARSNERSMAETEQLRRGLVYYRSLFERLLDRETESSRMTG